MELLLNLVWVALAIGLFLIFWRGAKTSARPRVPRYRSLIALAAVLLLLFPIISASDDLHPTQALAEEATRRASHWISPTYFSAGNSTPALLPVLLPGWVLTLIRLQPADSFRSKLCVLEGHRISHDGRGPPTGRS